MTYKERKKKSFRCVKIEQKFSLTIFINDASFTLNETIFI